MFALSVSISTSSSPTATSSPICLTHLSTVPSSIESESRGMTMSWTAVWGIGSDPRRDLGGEAEAARDLVDDAALVRKEGVLEARRVGGRGLRAGGDPGRLRGGE